MIAQPLHPTGHREPPSPEHPEQHTKSMPKKDANTNKTFFGPAGKLKSGRPQTFGKNANRSIGDQGAHRLQKARRKK